MTDLVAAARAFGNSVACFVPPLSFSVFTSDRSFRRNLPVLFPAGKTRGKCNLGKQEAGNFESSRTACQTPLLTTGCYSPYRFSRAWLFEWYRSHRGYGWVDGEGWEGGREQSDIFVGIDKGKKAASTSCERKEPWDFKPGRSGFRL